MKEQDMLSLGLLLAHRGQTLTYKAMASATGLSVGETHASVQRLGLSGLIDAKAKKLMPRATYEFLVYGLRYVFPARYGNRVRGLATLSSAGPLARHFVGTADPWVWPLAEGPDTGRALEPFYGTQARSCAKDPELYDWMTLFDCLRAGQARERRWAREETSARLGLQGLV